MTKNKKEPLFSDGFWKCPECNWQNPMPNTIILTCPSTICYMCRNCNYPNKRYS